MGTPAWFAWLEHHHTFQFAAPVGGFTASKSETDPNTPNWQAASLRQGQLMRMYLGPSRALTLGRLQAAAQRLAGEAASSEPDEGGQAPSAPSTDYEPQSAATVRSPSSLIRIKLYRPRRGHDVIARARLLEHLNAGLSGKLTLLCAPAGFGKTTLLVQWLQTLTRQVAWLSLDEHDNDLPVFVHGLTAALQSIWPDACQATASLLSAPSFPPPEHVATLLSHELADVPDEVVLVLDDYHLIGSREVHALLEGLIEQLPAQVHLVLATRFDPPLPLIRWLVKGDLHELRSADLRFTLEETEVFLTQLLGNDLAHQTAVALEEQTQGWIAVLRLAVLSLRSSSDRAALLQRLGHSPDRLVSRYLLEEVLAQLAPATQALLVRIAILDQFCTELCRAVLGTETSHVQVQAALDWLERSDLFLIPLDERQGWYRLHHLFQQLLQQRLQEHLSQEELTALHGRASAWYAEQGLIDEALHHALAAGDAAGAAQLVEAHFVWAFEHERWLLMERWLRLLPQEYIQSSPGLLLTRMWTWHAHAQYTDFPPLLLAAEQLVAANESRVPDRDDPQCKLHRALIAIWWSHFQYQLGQAQASLQSAHRALAWVPPEEAYVRCQAHFRVAVASQASGQEEEALVTLQQGLRDLPTRPTITARLLFAQALVYLAAGKLPHVEQTARHLLRLAQEADLAFSHSWAHWLLGVVHYERNELEAAVYHFSAVIANRYQAHVWTVQDALAGLALAYRAQGLGTQAQETAQGLLDWVQDQHNLHELSRAYAFCGQLALMQDEVEQASPWLELAGEPEGLGPMLFFEDPALTRAWMLLAKGDAASVTQGQVLLTHVVRHVEAIHSTRKTITVLALQAWASHLQGRVSEALEVLERTLLLARPAGFLRSFADVPQLARVLQELRRRRKVQQVVDKQLDAYLQRILVAMNVTPAQASSTEALLQQEGLEPLTEREAHILRLLDQDRTNKEIARELVVTPGTVKVHTNNLYRKLSVNNRRAAVTLAKALGLLAAS